MNAKEWVLSAAPLVPAAAWAHAQIDWQPLAGLVIARIETTVGQFRRH